MCAIRKAPSIQSTFKVQRSHFIWWLNERPNYLQIARNTHHHNCSKIMNYHNKTYTDYNTMFFQKDLLLKVHCRFHQDKAIDIEYPNPAEVEKRTFICRIPRLTEEVQLIMHDPICIEVNQVLDFCFQTEQQDVCLPLSAFTLTVPTLLTCSPGSTASCTLTSISCTEVSRTASTTAGFYDVTFLISYALTINIVNPTGTIIAHSTNTASFFKTVTLCAPDGAITECDITFSCGPCICIDDVVCCSFNLCIIIKSIFPVVLSVTGTVLTPTLCVTPSPFPPVCPPTVPTICSNCPPA